MSFPLIGNGNVKEQIERAVSLNRIPHAIIIAGENGLGKRTLARYIANCLVCTGDSKPCGVCKNCTVFAANSSPDIITVKRENGKKEIKIDQIRDVRADAYIKPHMANAKVYIIENADSMNPVAQNAFLKILEEPPENVYFILLAVNRDRLLDTVLSRTVTFNLSSPDIKSGAEIVAKMAKTDQKNAQDALLKTHSNIGAAIELLTGNGEKTPDAVAAEFLRLIFEGGSYELLKLINPYTKDRVFISEFLKSLKAEISAKIPTLSSGGRRARVLYNLYESIKEYEKMLITNANVPLLVSVMVADINEQLR